MYFVTLKGGMKNLRLGSLPWKNKGWGLPYLEAGDEYGMEYSKKDRGKVVDDKL